MHLSFPAVLSRRKVKVLDFDFFRKNFRQRQWLIKQASPNHDSNILRVESKNDSDITIPHPRFSRSDSTMRKRIREAVAESSSS